MRATSLLLAVSAVLLAVFASVSSAGVRPNILVVTTDDETVADMRVMPWTRSLIGDQGVSFDQSFVALECEKAALTAGFCDRIPSGFHL